MEDDFYGNVPDASTSLLGVSALDTTLHSLLSSPSGIVLTVLLGLVSIVVVTRWLSGRRSTIISGRKTDNVYTVPMLPYWIPFLGHGSILVSDPLEILCQARNKNPRGIFALKYTSNTLNVVTKRSLAWSVLRENKAAVFHQPVDWVFLQRFFGIPQRSKGKYQKFWEVLSSDCGHLARDNTLSRVIRKKTVQNLEESIPNMVTFINTDIDRQLWERFAKPKFISNSEIEVDLFSLVSDLLGSASVTAVFGPTLLEKYPNIMHDLLAMDSEMPFFLMGLPVITPYPGFMNANQARHHVLLALDDFQRALDGTVDGKPVDFSWGDMDNVSGFIAKRHAFFKDNGFDVKERPDIVILWALTAKTNLIAFWQLLHILTTPGLLSRIRTEIASFTIVDKPFSIGFISEAPKLTIHEALSTNCPLLRSTYLETLRVSTQPLFIRKLATDLDVTDDEISFILHKGECVVIPYALQMRDSTLFDDPQKFKPERFLSKNDDGSFILSSAGMEYLRLYGNGAHNLDSLSDLCKDGFLQEHSCLSLVAGVLAMWDITPVDRKSGWVIPKADTNSFVARPRQETRVRIKRRNFD